MTTTYTESFKRKIVQRLLMPGGPSQNAVARELDIPRSTISWWVRTSRKLNRMSNGNEGSASGPRRPEDWTAEERLRAVTEAGRLEGEELGKFLRREGLHEETLQEWKQAVLEALQPTRRSGNRSERRHIEKLERQLAKKAKALAAANAVVALQKKVHALLGDEDDDTTNENDE